METEKTFDAVRLMRELRDQLSREIEGMTFEQQLDYIHQRLDGNPALEPRPSADAAHVQQRRAG
jgi:hypothetical protein